MLIRKKRTVQLFKKEKKLTTRLVNTLTNNASHMGL